LLFVVLFVCVVAAFLSVTFAGTAFTAAAGFAAAAEFDFRAALLMMVGAA
jgi:hypothetical protein